MKAGDSSGWAAVDVAAAIRARRAVTTVAGPGSGEGVVTAVTQVGMREVVQSLRSRERATSYATIGAQCSGPKIKDRLKLRASIINTNKWTGTGRQSRHTCDESTPPMRFIMVEKLGRGPSRAAGPLAEPMLLPPSGVAHATATLRSRTVGRCPCTRSSRRRSLSKRKVDDIGEALARLADT